MLVDGLDRTVFSAHAEVVPLNRCVSHRILSILRARGGSSTTSLVNWGQVFSAHAEVVPYDRFIGFNEACILRARGGSSSRR